MTPNVWVEVDGGYVLASEIAAVVEVDGFREASRLVVVTKGGSRLEVGGSWSSARAFLDGFEAALAATDPPRNSGKPSG